MTQLALTMSAQAVTGANGITTIVIGPATQNEMWSVKRITVSNTSTSINMITATAYRNYVGPTSIIGATYSGQQDADSDFGQDFQGSENLVVQWLNADVDSICVVTISGTRTLKGVLIY